MKHYEYSKQYRKPKAARKSKMAELIITFGLTVITFMLVTAMALVMVYVWATHPAEQPITYAEHMACIQNGGDTYGIL